MTEPKRKSLQKKEKKKKESLSHEAVFGSLGNCDDTKHKI